MARLDRGMKFGIMSAVVGVNIPVIVLPLKCGWHGKPFYLTTII